jgi:peroxiredoxin
VFHPVGFELLAVSLDRELSQAADTARSLGLEFPVLHDRGGAVAELYEVDDLPLVVLIDREGAVREVVQGFSRADEDFFVSRVRGLLRE